MNDPCPVCRSVEPCKCYSAFNRPSVASPLERATGAPTDTDRLDWMCRHYAKFESHLWRADGYEETTVSWTVVDAEWHAANPWENDRRETTVPGSFRDALDAARRESDALLAAVLPSPDPRATPGDGAPPKFTVTAATKAQWRKFDSIALEVLCRVFDDGADRGFDEWRQWRDPGDWLSPQRALGAFIRKRLNRAALDDDQGETTK